VLRKQLTRGGVIALVLLLAAPSAGATFNYTAQTRSVTGTLSGFYGSDTESLSAPNFALFDATTSPAVPPYGGTAQQHQRSELLPSLIDVEGGASVFRPAMVGTGQATAQTTTSVTFNILTTTEVLLYAEGSVSNGLGIPSRSISLSGPGTSISWTAFNSPGLFPAVAGFRSTTATLGPGTYTFGASFYSSNNQIENTTSVPSFHVYLQEVPEPASLAVVLAAAVPLMRRRRH
jgi:hypothetical protein